MRCGREGYECVRLLMAESAGRSAHTTSVMDANASSLSQRQSAPSTHTNVRSSAAINTRASTPLLPFTAATSSQARSTAP